MLCVDSCQKLPESHALSERRAAWIPPAYTPCASSPTVWESQVLDVFRLRRSIPQTVSVSCRIFINQGQHNRSFTTSLLWHLIEISTKKEVTVIQAPAPWQCLPFSLHVSFCSWTFYGFIEFVQRCSFHRRCVRKCVLLWRSFRNVGVRMGAACRHVCTWRLLCCNAGIAYDSP